MGLKPGNEETTARVIPEGWGVRRLADLAPEIGDGIHSTPEYVASSEFYFINGNNLINGEITITDSTMCVGEAEWRKLRKKLNSRTVLMSINGTIGNLAFYRDEKIVLGKSAAYLNVAPGINKEYVFYSLFTSSTNKYFENELTGTTIRNLSLASLRNTPIPIPKAETEQRAVATCLGDLDALIRALDNLIAKKQDLKQATMQQLLTGKQRLPGFRGDWVHKPLADIFSISVGRSKSEYISESGRYWIVDMGAVSTDGRLLITKPTNYEKDFLKVGDLVMPKDDIGGGHIIGRVAYIDRDDTYVLGDHVYELRAKLGCSLFFSYMINSDQINAALRKKVSGSAQLGLSRKSVEEQEIPLPSIEEQNAIAAVLSDVDAEIVALEQRRDKTRALKQGMMQELLTGKTRLI